MAGTPQQRVYSRIRTARKSRSRTVRIGLSTREASSKVLIRSYRRHRLSKCRTQTAYKNSVTGRKTAYVLLQIKAKTSSTLGPTGFEPVKKQYLSVRTGGNAGTNVNLQTKRCVHLYNRRPHILQKKRRHLNIIMRETRPRTSPPASLTRLGGTRQDIAGCLSSTPVTYSHK